MKFRRKSGVESKISTSSMPDIIFMLLIFFMVTTVLREYSGLPVSLPKAERIEKLESKRHTSDIWVSKDGLISIEDKLFNNDDVPSRQDVIEQLIPYIKNEIKKGTRLNQIMRHTLGLFHGQTGASYWKRYLSENMCVRDADVKKIDHIMDKIKYNNIDTSVGQSA